MTIFYLCPDESRPYGGMRVIYHHVDILTKNGYDARILHSRQGFHLDWFKHAVPLSYGGERIQLNFPTSCSWKPITKLKVNFPEKRKGRLLTEEDIIVFPEVYGNQIKSFPQAVRKVIFNQSGHYTFWNHPSSLKDSVSIYSAGDISAVITTSDFSTSFVQYAFPKVPIHRVPLSIDPERFSRKGRKRSQLCYFPRKNIDEAEVVIQLLKARGVFHSFDLVPIQNASDNQVTRILQDSMFFLSFGHHEGFGLPAAEAMACGCVVIGYHGGGGREFFKPRFSFPIETGETLLFAQTVEKLLHSQSRQMDLLLKKGCAASEFILSKYTTEREESSLLSAWRSILG